MSQDSSLLDVAVIRTASAVTVTVTGELDIDTGETLVDRVGAAFLDGPPEELVLDAGGLRFCDSAGINALVRLRKVADEQGSRFVMVHAQSPVRRVLELTGLREYLNLDDENLDGGPTA